LEIRNEELRSCETLLQAIVPVELIVDQFNRNL